MLSFQAFSVAQSWENNDFLFFRARNSFWFLTLFLAIGTEIFSVYDPRFFLLRIQLFKPGIFIGESPSSVLSVPR